MNSIARPKPEEYAPYYETFVAKVPSGDIVETLSRGIEDTDRLLGGLTGPQAAFRYAPGKWSITEIAGHLCDTERVYTYRALRFARGDATALPGFDQDKFVAEAARDPRLLSDVLAEFRAVRAATVAFFRGVSPEALLRRGTANGFEFSVRAILYILAGHEIHHRRVIETRYLRIPEPPESPK